MFKLKWNKIEKYKREWIIIFTIILLLGVLPRLNLPTKIPFPEEYPLKRIGTFEEGARSYKEGKFSLALANFISSASHQGDARSMSMAARMYIYGKGVQRDICQGIYWADMAARKGIYLDQERLSRAYFSSYGIKEDDEKAYLWAKAAVDNTSIKSTNEWFKELTGETVDPKTWMNFIKNGFDQKQIDTYSELYSKWNYKKETPVTIIRTRHLPFIGMSTITPCSQKIN